MENLPCDAVKPAEENNKQRCNLSESETKHKAQNSTFPPPKFAWCLYDLYEQPAETSL